MTTREQRPAAAIDRLDSDLASGATVILDGATGTEIEVRGATMHDKVWCATATRTHPDILRDVHVDYIRAGARVITTNTFSTNRNMLDPAGLGDEVESLNRRAVEVAREARDAAGVPGVVVAGSMSHQVPFASDSDGHRVRVIPEADVALANFREMAHILAEAGADLILLEMMSDPDLMVPALEAARETGLEIWFGFSVRTHDDGTLHSYSRADLGVAEMLDSVSLEGVAAAGVMHSYVSATGPTLSELRTRYSGTLMAYPDSGYFRMPHWVFEDIIAPDEFADACVDWRNEGVQILGGCCGLGLDHIRALSQRLAQR